MSLGSDGGCLLEAAAAGFDAALLLGGGAAGLCFSKIPITACLEVGYGNQKKILPPAKYPKFSYSPHTIHKKGLLRHVIAGNPPSPTLPRIGIYMF